MNTCVPTITPPTCTKPTSVSTACGLPILPVYKDQSIGSFSAGQLGPMLPTRLQAKIYATTGVKMCDWFYQ